MAVTVEATYENGSLKLPNGAPPLLKDGDRVWITLHISSEEDVVRKSYGIIGWQGDAQTVQRVALDPEFDVLGSP
ncbi:MAG: antitoxin family protein [Gemmataceae bacterium]